MNHRKRAQPDESPVSVSEEWATNNTNKINKKLLSIKDTFRWKV